MNIKPLGAAPQQPNAQPSSRDRAVAAFNQANQQAQSAQPVLDASNVSPEEMSAIIPATEQVEEIENKVEEQKPEEQSEISRKYAQLARQEKAFRDKVRQQEQAYKQRLAELEQKQQVKQPEVDMTKYRSIDQIKQDALQVLADAGVSYEELTQQILNQTPRDPRMDKEVSELRQQIQELKQAKDDAKKWQEEQQTQQYQAAVKQIENDVKSLINSDPNFETIKATKSSKDVVDLITETYHKDGILMTVEEAAQQVEDYLVDEALKFTQINKIKQKLAASSATKQQAKPEQTPGKTDPKQPQMKTLTNQTGVSRQLSAKERAILAFKGELK